MFITDKLKADKNAHLYETDFFKTGLILKLI